MARLSPGWATFWLGDFLCKQAQAHAHGFSAGFWIQWISGYRLELLGGQDPVRLWRSLTDIRLPASACAIGMFDGVHVGHRMVLENALRESRLMGCESVVFSFADHPQCLISKTPTQLLSDLDERLAIFDAMGFHHALILDFDESLRSLTADAFIRQVLLERLAVKSVTVGYDHRFGADRKGDSRYLTEAGRREGFDVQVIDPVKVGDQIVSSTLIRKLLAYGELEQANLLLGRPYQVTGIVEHGLERGRQLGFPTANLSISPRRLVPANGTYAGTAVLNNTVYPAVCNIGLSPTFGDQDRKRVEVHLLGYEGSAFYDQPLTMRFDSKLRDERRFSSPDALIRQIQEDCRRAAHAYQHAGNQN
jgi:riboflavin kinase/FMN adenylyltransferase